MIERLQSFTVEDDEPCRPRVCRLDSESATDVIDAIASDTARAVLAALHDQPRPVSRLAEEMEMSIPSVNYHVENLEAAGLVTQVDTWYSEKGNEMAVYGPTDDPLVFVGSEEGDDLVRSAVARVGAALVGIAVTSAVVHWLTTRVLPALTDPAVRKATSAGTVEGPPVATVPPGLLFFSGATFVLALALAAWYLAVRRRRTAPRPAADGGRDQEEAGDGRPDQGESTDDRPDRDP
jgi:DNA-binding transcriptional ArsR family regulator